MKLGNAALALLVATNAAAQMPREIPPPPPALRLNKSEDDALRAVTAAWSAQRRVKSSPLIITIESLPYAPAIEPYLRLELQRRDVSAAMTEALLADLRERNRYSWSLESPALEGSMRIRFFDILVRGLDPKSASDPSLQNFGDLRAITVPGVARESAIIFYAIGPQMTNTLYGATGLAFVKEGTLVWEHRFGRHDLQIARNAAPAPRQALFSTDDLSVIEVLLNRCFPDRTRVPLVVNQTRTYSFAERIPAKSNEFDAALQARNEVPLFISRLDIGRKLTMVPRERLFVLDEKDLAGAPGIIEFSLPAYSTDNQRASILYTIAIPRDGDLEIGSATAVLLRGSGGWTVSSDDYHVSATTKIDPNSPIRVGGDVKPPLVRKRVPPQFPPGTRSGVMILELIIGRDGRVISATVMTTRGAAADQAAIDAVRQWEFQPGTLSGRPVPVIYNISLSVP